MTDRTIRWEHDGDDAGVVVLDQTRLPHDVVEVVWHDLEAAAVGIETMQVRGAPLIGVAAAHGLALGLRTDPSSLDVAVDRLLATRPTAVNLRWALERARTTLEPLPLEDRAAAARGFARLLADGDAEACRRLGDAGVELLAAIHARTEAPVHVLTHCNAGRLACVEWGTATAPVYVARERGIPVHVWVSETRPRNQGAALTAWELADAGIPHTLVVDNAAGHLLATGQVDIVLVGADRIAANGDTANKIGTSLKAYAADVHQVPFVVCAPRSTFDARCPDGTAIPIEERDPTEVTEFGGVPVAPPTTVARNWGFDVTPARFVHTFVTEDGLVGVDSLTAFLDETPSGGPDA